MIYSQREMERFEQNVKKNPKHRSWLYRVVMEEREPGTILHKANDVMWEGKIFCGQDFLMALEDGWQDNFYVGEVPTELKGTKIDPEYTPPWEKEGFLKQEPVEETKPEGAVKDESPEVQPTPVPTKPGKLGKKRKQP